MNSKGIWNGCYVSTLYSMISVAWFGIAVVTLLISCKSSPEYLNQSENSLRKWEEPPIRQWELWQMAFLAALVLDFASWLWTVDKDKSRLFYLVVVINGLPIVSYGLLANGWAPVWVDCRGRRIILIRYLQWLFTTPAMLYLYSILSDFPENELIIALVLEVICIISGFFASFARFPFDIVSLAISCATFYYVISAINKMMMLAIEDTSVDDDDYRKALNGARIFMVVTWIGMPFVWLLAYFDMVSMTSEETLYEILDFSTKSGVSAMILHSSIKMYSEKLEDLAQLALSEERNRTILALQEASQMKDKFFTAMSHELRTPLNGIIGLADGLMVGSCGEVPDKVRDRLGTIKLSGQRLCSLVNDILDAASLRHGALRLIEDNVILVDVCAHVVELTRAVAKPGVAVSCHVDPDVPIIRGDPERIKQILHNLLGNAAKFTAKGSIALRVELDRERRNVLLSVTDTGAGIPETQLHKIWGAFNQGEEGMARHFGGTGLGLTIAQQLAEAHGGQVVATSTVGSGSIFTLILPVTQVLCDDEEGA